jgi:hypothetical protein
VPSVPELYAELRAEHRKLERAVASRSEWLLFTHRVLEAVMAAQSQVLELQQRVLVLVTDKADAAAYGEARNHAKDAVHALDGLTSLYERTRQRIAAGQM